MQNFIIRITQENNRLLKDNKIGCYILPDDCSEKFAESFIEEAKNLNKLVLIEGPDALNIYKKFKADGLILNTVKDPNPQKIIKQTKEAAKHAFIGVITRNRRHEAMLVSECEPDFVIFRFWSDGFAENAELLKWYSELFLIQNAAQIEEDCDYKQLPADFIILTDKQYL